MMYAFLATLPCVLVQAFLCVGGALLEHAYDGIADLRRLPLHCTRLVAIKRGPRRQ